jgi:hypothetical protein
VDNSKSAALPAACPEKKQSDRSFVIACFGVGSSTLASMKDHVTPLGTAANLFAAVLLWSSRSVGAVED